MIRFFFFFLLLDGIVCTHLGNHAVVKKDWDRWDHVVNDEENHVVEIKGFPKSGTTWLEYILLAILDAYCAHRECAPELKGGSFFRSITMDRLHILVNPRTRSTKHGLASKWYWPDMDNYRYVVILRDPRANLVSYRFWSGGTHVDEHIALKKHFAYISDLWDTLREDPVRRYRTYLIQYEYLLSNPSHVIKDLSEWLGIPLDDKDSLAQAVHDSSAEHMRDLETHGRLNGESHLSWDQQHELDHMEAEKRKHIPVKVRSASIEGWKEDSSWEDQHRWERWIEESSKYPAFLRECYVGKHSCYARNQFLCLQHLALQYE
jgi:hypothetical protein